MIKNASKKNAVFINEGKVYTMRSTTAAPDQRLFDTILKKHPKAVILNNMDITEASKLILLAQRALIDKELDSMPGGPKF